MIQGPPEGTRILASGYSSYRQNRIREVVNAQKGVLRPTTYRCAERRYTVQTDHESQNASVREIGIHLAPPGFQRWRSDPRIGIRDLDLLSGAPLYTKSCGSRDHRWPQMNPHLSYTEIFPQEEDVEDPGDSLPNYIFRDGKVLQIHSSCRRNDHPFFTLGNFMRRR